MKGNALRSLKNSMTVFINSQLKIIYKTITILNVKKIVRIFHSQLETAMMLENHRLKTCMPHSNKTGHKIEIF